MMIRHVESRKRTPGSLRQFGRLWEHGALLAVAALAPTVVINGCGMSGTGTAAPGAPTLTVNPAPVAPTITTQPANQTVTAGQTATFTVVAAGTAPLSYQWQKSGVNIAGATSTSYTTAVTTTADSGSTFAVVVTNTARRRH